MNGVGGIRAKLISGVPLDAEDRSLLVTMIEEYGRLKYPKRAQPTVAGLTEADIVINGTTLGFGASMAVRVAVSSFLMSLSDPDARATLGPIGDGYHDRLREVEGLIFKAFR